MPIALEGRIKPIRETVMCYSAQLHQDYREYLREHGATLDVHEFARLFWKRDREGKWVKIPNAMEAAFLASGDVPEINELIDKFRQDEIETLEQEIFVQKKRVADAERKLRDKVTKKAQDDVRIGTNKIEQVKGWLGDLKRNKPQGKDSRIYPGWYAPVMVVEDGKRIVRPMRYGCLPAGKPKNFEKKYPNTYNARRDNLEGYWKVLFGHTHGLIIADVFYENVETGGKNEVLAFTPRTGEPMLIACLWSRWTDPKGEEPDLFSFAAITDDPEPEVAAAGHDRTIINIKPEHIEAWLNPEPSNLDAIYAIFDDRRHPYYEHRIAA